MHHDNPVKSRLTPGAVTDGYMYGHDVSGPFFAEPITGNTRTVEALERTHQPRLTLEPLSRRVLRHGHPWSRGVGFTHARECTSIDVYVRSRSFTQVGRCLLWPHGMG